MFTVRCYVYKTMKHESQWKQREWSLWINMPSIRVNGCKINWNSSMYLWMVLAQLCVVPSILIETLHHVKRVIWQHVAKVNPHWVPGDLMKYLLNWHLVCCILISPTHFLFHFFHISVCRYFISIYVLHLSFLSLYVFS